MKRLCEKFNTITVKRGEAFELDIMAYPSIGLVWDLASDADKKVEVLSAQIGSYKATKWWDCFAQVSGAMTQTFNLRAGDEAGEVVLQAEQKNAHCVMQKQNFKIKIV